MNFEASYTANLKNGDEVILKGLTEDDVSALAIFFESLGKDTRSRFGPHPLTAEHAELLCLSVEWDDFKRMVVWYDDKIVGYFLLGYRVPEEESKRYTLYDIELFHHADVIFAPCIIDQMQGAGIASAVMPHIIQYLKEENARSIVLLGGTQAPNERAVHFYKKFGFIALGSFITHVKNIDMWLKLQPEGPSEHA